MKIETEWSKYMFSFSLLLDPSLKKKKKKKKQKKKEEEEKEEALFRSVASTDVALLSEPFFVSRHTSKATIVKT